MKIDADVVLRIHVHDEQETDEDDKEILSKFQKNADDIKQRFAGYVRDMANERFNDEIADGYFKIDTEVKSLELTE